MIDLLVSGGFNVSVHVEVVTTLVVAVPILAMARLLWRRWTHQRPRRRRGPRARTAAPAERFTSGHRSPAVLLRAVLMAREDQRDDPRPL